MAIFEGGISARRASGFVALVLSTAALLDSGPLLRAAQALPGPERGIATAFARPINAFAEATGLSAPRKGLLSLLGRPDNTQPSELTVLPPAGSASSSPIPVVPTVPLRPVPIGTLARPLRVLVTGDSLSDYLGEQIIQLTAHAKTIVSKISTHNGTGLARPDVFDWARAAHTAVAQSRPDVVIVALGANDDQGIALPGPIALQVGTTKWAAEYARRAEIVMQIMVNKGTRRVYWMGLPTVREKKMNRDYGMLNDALKVAASAVPGVTYVDTRLISQVHGKFSDYLYDGGHRILARQPDGVHFTYEGSKIPAEKVLETAAPILHLPPRKAPVKKP